MTRHLFLILLVASTVPALARQLPNTPPLLDLLTGGVENEPMVLAASDQMNWFNSNRYGVAYGDELDIRLGQTSNDRYEYGFRFRPTNPFFFAAGKQMGRVLEEKAELMYREALEEAIYERALELLEIWESAARLQHLQQATEWRQQWVDNMKNLVGTGTFDPEQLLSLEIEKIDLKVDATALEDELEIDLRQLGARTSTPISADSPAVRALLFSFKFDSLLVGGIVQNVGSDSSGLGQMPLAVKRTQLEEKESSAKLLLERADWDVGFIQPEWDDQGGDTFGLRLGIGIPVFRGNRMQRQNKELELIGDKWEQVKAFTAWEEESEKASARVLQWVDRLATLDTLSLQLDQYRGRMVSMDSDKAREAMLKWTKAKEKLRNRKFEVQFLLLQSYVDYLKLTGRLTLADSGSFFRNIW